MKHRPILFDLNPLHLTLAALVSILHRISGILIFFLIPLLIWLLQSSLHSEQDFELLKLFFNRLEIKLGLGVVLAAFLFHLLAGIRHMLMDIHIGENKSAGKISAAIVLFTFLFLMLGFGVYVAWK